MSRLIRVLLAAIVVFSIGSSLLFAQGALRPFRTEIPPVLDGVLDDDVWQKAPSETGFKTYYPDYGSSMSEATKVWYAYDRENLYFAFKCYDSEPDKIKTSVTARDKIRPDDWICLNLDTFNDQQSLYAFYTNPAGVQMDSRANAVDEDMSIDFVWYSDGKIDEEGYSIEVKIPFKSVRFSHHEPVEMGIIFERYISRKSEAGTYPALDPKWGMNFLTQTRTLQYENIKHYTLLELLPAVTYSQNSSIEEGTLRSEGDDSELSLTAKYGITSHLILDGTINPDFSQVEADAGQVDFNQRYALYYPEKRPFFLEGRENFIFGGSSEGDPLGAVVHTRNIVDPSIGLKLTGKIGDRNTLATIYARDELPDDLGQGDHADVAILRYKRAMSQDGFIGGFFTDRERENGYNRVLGSDGQLRINRSSHIGFHGFLSQTKDDDASKKIDGHAAGVNYYYRTRDWFINMRLHDLSRDFNTETGYITRTDVTRIRAGIMRMLYPTSRILKRIDPLLNNQFILDKESDLWENNNAFYVTFILPRTTSFRIGYAYATEIFRGEKFDDSGVSIIGSSQLTKQFYFDFTYSYGDRIRYIYDPAVLPYQGYGSSASASVIYQPSENFRSSLDFVYSDFYQESTDTKEYDYSIVRFFNTYQVNKYLFFRAIVEYNSFYEELKSDLLASFTYIPGTVIHLGYGSLYNKLAWENGQYVDSDRFLEMKRGFFFKTSYLWRM
ncbi:MAG: DUF5916 domain-containing protein [Candidatus Zhuqueibacterota bacterium]